LRQNLSVKNILAQTAGFVEYNLGKQAKNFLFRSQVPIRQEISVENLVLSVNQFLPDNTNQKYNKEF